LYKKGINKYKYCIQICAKQQAEVWQSHWPCC